MNCIFSSLMPCETSKNITFSINIQLLFILFAEYDRKTFEKVINNIEFPDQEHICDYFFGIKKSANN